MCDTVVLTTAYYDLFYCANDLHVLVMLYRILPIKYLKNIKVAAMPRHRPVLWIGRHFYHCLWNQVRESSSL